MSVKNSIREEWEEEVARTEHNAQKISQEWLSKQAHDEDLETRRVGAWELEREKTLIDDGRAALEALRDELDNSIHGTAKRCSEKQTAVQAAISQLYEASINSIYSMMYHDSAEGMVGRARVEELAATAGHTRALTALNNLASDLEDKHTASCKEAEVMLRETQRRFEDEGEESCGVTRVILESRLAKLLKEAEAAETVHGERVESVQPGGQAAQRRLIEADERDEASIRASDDELLRLETKIAHWREKTAKHAAAWQLRIDAAHEAKSAAVKEYSNVQHGLLNEQHEHEKALKAISISADQTEAHLGEIVRLAERTKKCLHIAIEREDANCITI
jgi:hypothetical protein